MSLEQYAWGVTAVALFLALVLAVALGALDAVNAENKQLRALVHPSTRNRKAVR